MILALYMQLVHTFVKQMPLNAPFSLITLENGINLIYNYMMQNLSRNLEMLKLGQLTPDSLYATHHSLGLKLLTRFTLSLSHLDKHRFKHNFESCFNPPLHVLSKLTQLTIFFLHCHYYLAFHIFFLDYLNTISPQFELFPEDVFVKILLYGFPKLLMKVAITKYLKF